MKIKSKFTVYNIIMLITPILLIGVVSLCFVLAFIIKFPVEEFNITRASMIEPHIFMQAVGEFFKSNPGAIMYVAIWLIICVSLVVLSTTVATALMTKSIASSVNELARATDYIRSGNLDFEVMGSEYDEIDRLCGNFDMLRKELKLARERERYMKNERNMLLANISHDLKTPITSIKGYVEGLRDGIADTAEKRERYLDTILSKAEHIDDLVNNLSVFSKLELSKLTFNFTGEDINAFLRDFVESYRLDIERNDISLKTDISCEKCIVKTDCEKMSRVFANLIDNAVKYRSGDNSFIYIKTTRKDGGIYIVVSDNGIGIDENEIKRVFDGFYRVDTSRSIKGSGLGLGIAKQIVEKHGGKLWLKSDGLGKGTDVIVYLPEIGGGNR